MSPSASKIPGDSQIIFYQTLENNINSFLKKKQPQQQQQQQQQQTSCSNSRQ
jgi:hypothetical protein